MSDSTLEILRKLKRIEEELDVLRTIEIPIAGGGPGFAHNILSASHFDSTAAACVRGDIITGQGIAHVWRRLAISVPAANVRNVLGVDNGDVESAWKTALDAVAPTTIAESAAAAAGTSLVFSHRDHTHGAPATWAATGHGLLSATHDDTTAAAVVQGDIIVGRAGAPAWARLALSVPAANVRNVLGIDNGGAEPAWKTALDAVAPTTIAEGAAAAAGTSLVFSHRDHTHGAPATWAATAHALLSATHSDTAAAAVADGALIIGNVTPAWSRLVISIPAAGTLNYLGVNNGELRPSWKSASSNPGAAAAMLQSNTSGYLQLVRLGAGVSPAVTLQSLSTTEQLRLSYDAGNYISFTVDDGSNTELATSSDLFGDVTIHMHSDTTNAVSRGCYIKASNPDAATTDGFGVYFGTKAEDETEGTIRDMFRISSLWSDATDASRKARAIFYIYDTSARDFMQVDATGAGATIALNGNTTLAASTFLTALTDGSGGGLRAGSGGDVLWHRGAANLWQTPDSVKVDVGVNVGTASGATAGQVRSSGALFPGAVTTHEFTAQYLTNSNDHDKVAIGLTDADTALIFIYSPSTSYWACYLLNGGYHTTTEIFDPSNKYTVTEDNDTTTNIYWDAASARYELNNETGGVARYFIWMLRGA